MDSTTLNNCQIDFLDCYDKDGSLVIKCPECGNRIEELLNDPENRSWSCTCGYFYGEYSL